MYAIRSYYAVRNRLAKERYTAPGKPLCKETGTELDTINIRAIGIIGGMSFESSALYFRKINEAVFDCRFLYTSFS